MHDIINENNLNAHIQWVISDNVIDNIMDVYAVFLSYVKNYYMHMF